MASKGGGGAQQPQSTECCCMCGDHGITEELFWCRSCQFRYQHRYCSDLYPKAETYKLCNWCLGEESKKKINCSPSTENNGYTSILSSTANETNNEEEEEEDGGRKTKVQRCTFPSQLDKPIKKQKQRPKLERSASEVIVRSKYALRGKIRRYKLVEQVSS